MIRLLSHKFWLEALNNWILENISTSYLSLRKFEFGLLFSNFKIGNDASHRSICFWTFAYMWHSILIYWKCFTFLFSCIFLENPLISSWYILPSACAFGFCLWKNVLPKRTYIKFHEPILSSFVIRHWTDNFRNVSIFRNNDENLHLEILISKSENRKKYVTSQKDVMQNFSPIWTNQ